MYLLLEWSRIGAIETNPGIVDEYIDPPVLLFDLRREALRKTRGGKQQQQQQHTQESVHENSNSSQEMCVRGVLSAPVRGSFWPDKPTKSPLQSYSKSWRQNYKKEKCPPTHILIGLLHFRHLCRRTHTSTEAGSPMSSCLTTTESRPSAFKSSAAFWPNAGLREVSTHRCPGTCASFLIMARPIPASEVRHANEIKHQGGNCCCLWEFLRTLKNKYQNTAAPLECSP